MPDLPGKAFQLLLWWTYETPKNIFVIIRRVSVLINNSLSFTRNLRLIFTPLFGDRTIIGRFIGVSVRLAEILVGLAFMFVLFAVNLVAPLFWFVLPFVLYYYLGYYTILVYTGMLFLWFFGTKNTPLKTVAGIKNGVFRNAVRPLARLYLAGSKDKTRGLLSEPQIKYLLRKAELTSPDFVQKIIENHPNDPAVLLKKAYDYALAYKTSYIEAEHIFLAAVAGIPNFETFLAMYETNLTTLEKTVEWVVNERESLAKLYIWQPNYEMIFTGGIGKGMTGRVTPNLDAVSQDFTKLVLRGRLTKIVDRESEIERIAQILSGTKENILIIGESGSGKTSIVRGMAFEVIAGTKYKTLANKRIVSLGLGGLISGASTAGQIAEKIRRLMDEVKASRDIILFVDEIHTLVAGGGDEKADTATVFALLEPYLASGDIQVIGATSIPNYRKYVEPNGAFARLFQIVEIKQASKEDSLEILKDSAKTLETKHKILITYPALVTTVDLSEKLIHERVLPDKAIDILSRAATRVAETTKVVTSRDITKEVTEMTHVPVEAVSQDEATKLLSIENELKKLVIGQDTALSKISAALKRARVGIRNENKPIASFLFVGTTGVGKTQTAKALAKTYFGSSKTMIRLDMSEYQQIDSIDRLIGSPDGTTKGMLTEAVRTSPYALVLLDEIEKAHQNILLTFLQVLDDARLTDSSGTTVDFTNTIIIATSNVGTRSIQSVAEHGGMFEEMESAAMAAIREKFAPEFLNRFNSIITFRPITPENLRQIALLLLNDVKEMAQQKGVKLSFREPLIEALVKKGYTPEWGARPLGRVIEDTVETYLAEKLLTGEIAKGQEINLGTEVFST